MQTAQPTLVDVTEREEAQTGLNKALFQYQVSLINYDYAQSQLDIYKDLYFKAKQRIDYITGGLENGS